MNQETLESLIRRYVVLGPPSARGFHQVKCQVCNDYKVRGGFKFEGDCVGYSCFNCGAKGLYDPSKVEPNQRYKISKSFMQVLTSFGVPEDEIKKATAANFFKELSTTEAKQEKQLYFPTKEVPLPEPYHLVTTDGSPWCEVARQYLANRKLEPDGFYVSDHEKYECRVILPYLYRGKIVYWQARSMDPSVEPRYKNPVADRDNIFYNMDEVYRYTDDPLFVTEGPIDAASIGSKAVATLGSELSEFQWRELKKAGSRRRVIFVIDKNRNGHKLGVQVLDAEVENFYVACFPDNIEDANDALCKLGKLFIATHLVTSSAKGFQGKLLLEMKCSKR